MINQFKLYGKINFKKEVQYRGSALSGLITQIFFGLLQIMILVAFYGSGPVSLDVTLVQMASYIWIKQAFYAMFKFYNSNKSIADQIVNGDISYQLTKPVNIYSQWFFDSFTSNFSKAVLRGPVLILVALLLPAGLGLMLPASFLHFVLFVVSIMLGSLILVAINNISYTLVTITLSPTAVFGIVNAIAQLLAGQMIPLPLFPKAFQNVVNWLPFRYTTDLPSRIYAGAMTINDALIQIGVQIAWLVIIVLFGKWFLSKRLNKLVVQGG